MAQVTIEQRPLYDVLPVGQQIMFSVSDNTTVATKFKVKFVAEVHVSNQNINLSNNNARIGLFKTTPNNKGVGIFDLRSILETFVKPDNEGSKFGNGSRYKGTEVAHPVHLIDKFAVSENAIKFFAVQFFVEWAEGPDDSLQHGGFKNTGQFIIFNGVLPYDYPLTLENGDFGYGLAENYWYLSKSGGGKFLTNAPATFGAGVGEANYRAKARLTDYGTLPFLDWLPDPTTNDVVKFEFFYYYQGVLQDSESLNYGWTPGGVTNFGKWVYQYLVYFGAFPANLRSWSTKFQALITAGTIDHYFIRPHNTEGGAPGYYIDIICPNGEGYNKGYEMIRLTWLNQWGTWDYYTFNMKSTRSIKTKRIPYTQSSGTWNESTFKIKGWKGGKKNFRVNSTEKIKINTDFVNEAEGVWLEELMSSTEVYIVKEYESGDDSATITNKYIEPVTVTTSKYVTKTIANDKLMQYTFEIEKGKMQRTQSA